MSNHVTCERCLSGMHRCLTRGCACSICNNPPQAKVRITSSNPKPRKRKKAPTPPKPTPKQEGDYICEMILKVVRGIHDDGYRTTQPVSRVVKNTLALVDRSMISMTPEDLEAFKAGLKERLDAPVSPNV